MRPLTATEMIGPASAPTAGGNGYVDDSSDGFEALSRREWLSVNGIGGFASGTVAGATARRYHALLVAAPRGTSGRMTLLGKVDETVTVNGERYDLSTNRYPNGIVYPDGWRYISEFTPWPVPTWTYRLPGDSAVLVKRVYLARGKNTVYVTYTLREAPAMAQLTLTPLVCWKEYHSEMHPWAGFPLRRGPEVGGWYVQPTPDAPTLRLLARGAKWTVAGWWHERLTHDRERERGLDFQEDLFCPAVAVLNLRVGQTVAFIATIEPGEPDDATLALAEIVRHQESLVKKAGIPREDEAGRDLVLATDPFIVDTPDGRKTVIAGYPWFTDWGRDTMIALPGLCLSTGRFEVARDILSNFAGFVSEGMIPNRFPDRGETPDYNTVDATLWFIHACDRYVEASGDKTFQEIMLPVLEHIVTAHVQGTRFGIHRDANDGLLAAGNRGTQLTWMDAKIGDWVITPRDGKPVEINALWVNALRILTAWSTDNDQKAQYGEMAEQAVSSFRAKFVRPDGQGLYDRLCSDGTPDGSIRPNQVIAAALPYTPLTDDEIKAVVEVTTRELLTPYGLRTLSPGDPAYRGSYFGSPRQRDAAYHQGTVWPWLLGSYIDAYRRVYGADADVEPLLTSLISHLREFGVGGIAEVFDGNSPFYPNGCPWQAWSVAELLRARQKS
jgi:predicted glycogen debranching enzyme